MGKFKKVAIIGVGLIGGSIALGLKKKKIAGEIVGVSRKQKTLVLAKKRKAIDKAGTSLSIVKDADLLILATPVNTIIKLAPKIFRLISKGCIVTDVGSTKKIIVKHLDRFFSNYIGSHPLAGSEKQSIRYAQPDLFKHSLCILTPTNRTKTNTLKKVEELWKILGAQTVLMTPDKHDKILSLTSHLPHIAAFSLMNVIPKKFFSLAASGIRDSTRIAASGSELWTDIIFSNQKNIIKSIGLLQDSLSRIRSAIKRKDRRTLNKIISEAKLKRESL